MAVQETAPELSPVIKIEIRILQMHVQTGHEGTVDSLRHVGGEEYDT